MESVILHVITLALGFIAEGGTLQISSPCSGLESVRARHDRLDRESAMKWRLPGGTALESVMEVARQCI
jgi:hypothetical protein